MTDRPLSPEMQAAVKRGYITQAEAQRRQVGPVSLDERRRRKSKQLEDTDLANARRFVQQNGDEVRWTPERGWLVWDGIRWEPDALNLVNARARRTVEAIFDEIPSARDKDEVFRWAKRSQSGRAIKDMLFLARTFPGISVHMAEFDTDPWLLNCENGIIDLRSGELLDHDPALMCTRLAPVEYVRDAKCDLWMKFLKRIMVEDYELIRFLKCATGYALTGSNREQALFFAFGHGANGKSVFLETLQAMLGDYAMNTRTETITARRDSGIPNDIARLAGARLVTINETAENQKLHEPLIKDMTGGDTMTARFLHHEYFDFKPEFKLWLRGNHKPEILGTDEGIWRRMRLIPFAVTIPAEERDLDLRDKLLYELPGILAWAVRGCLDWQESGLGVPAAVADAVLEYRSEMDVVGQFLEECCNIRPNAQATAKALYAKYRYWAAKSGVAAATQTRFGRALAERGYHKQRTRSGVVYLDIELQTESHHQNEV